MPCVIRSRPGGEHVSENCHRHSDSTHAGHLGSAMYFMMKDRGKTDRTVNALKWRIGIWGRSPGVHLAAAKLGWLEPSNSLVKKPQPTESAAPKTVSHFNKSLSQRKSRCTQRSAAFLYDPSPLFGLHRDRCRERTIRCSILFLP